MSHTDIFMQNKYSNNLCVQFYTPNSYKFMLSNVISTTVNSRWVAGINNITSYQFQLQAHK